MKDSEMIDFISSRVIKLTQMHAGWWYIEYLNSDTDELTFDSRDTDDSLDLRTALYGAFHAD